ncbi:hypothetical protein Lepto7375DRAFT_7779 [Leptolyngbya sp. PCC 7375]|nr:hypothetical protein Lepto7375DRAFT_7779 [Leptolyngbya sp. PCC 7375]
MDFTGRFRFVSIMWSFLNHLYRQMPKAGHSQHGQPKTERVNALLTEQGKTGLTALAKDYQVSVSELLDLLGRGELEIKQPGEPLASST